jgi:DNA-binding response OmpR family regulator
VRHKVLVVEDDSQLAHLYCTALALRGIGSVRVADGLAALRSIEEQRPSLILLDLMLPGLDGDAILRDLAASPLTCDVPVIVVTGVEPPPRLPHALFVLAKPCDPDHIAKLVDDQLPALAN